MAELEPLSLIPTLTAFPLDAHQHHLESVSVLITVFKVPALPIPD